MSGSIAGRAAMAAGLVALAAFLAGFLIAEEGGSSLAWLALLAAIAGAAVGFVALYSTQRPMAALSRAARAIGEGDLRYRVEVSSSATQDLEHAFNTMANRVQQLVAETIAEHARLEAVFDAAADGFIALAGDTTVWYLNPAASRLLEVDGDRAIGRPFIESSRDYELDELARRTAAREQMQSNVITYGADRIPLRVVGVPIEGGGDWAVLLVLNDLTEVQRVDQVRRDFLSNVSHELRTPLSSVRAMVETVGELQERHADEHIGEFVRRSLKQLDRLGSLVDELLDLSRIESGAISLHPEDVELASVVTEAADAIAPIIRGRSIRLVLPEAPEHVEADRRSLVRIVTNLLDNAAKYSPEGGDVAVSTRRDGDLVELSVSDQGPGIAAEDLPRVFERFYKADSSRSNEGVGLGLAIVKHLVRAHRGTVAAQSGEEGGATFSVRLPRHFIGVAAERAEPRLQAKGA